MSLQDIATINVSSTGAGVTRPGYGVPLIVSHTATWAERVRTYTSLAAVQADFAANTPEYLAASKIFAQQPSVTSIKIGRAALKPTQKFAIGVQAANATGLNIPFKLRVAVATGSAWVSQDATYNSGGGSTAWGPSGTWSAGDLISVVGGLYTCLGQSGKFGGATGIGAASGPSGLGAAVQEGQVFWMFVASGASYGAMVNDAIMVGLKAKVEALSAPAVVGTGTAQLASSLQGSQGSRTLQLLANTPAQFFGLRVYKRDRLNIAQTHADPGIATDLAAINLEDKSWYGLVTLFNSSALISATEAWVEANTKLYPAASLDSAIATDANSIATDIAHTAQTQAYARSWVMHHPSNDEFMDAGELGRWFPVSPGGETWRMKPLTGVTEEAYTDTEITNMKAKFAHFYYDVSGGVGNPAVGGDAKDAAGEYIDTVRFIDWYTANLQGDLADLALQSNKIPFTNPGIDKVEGKVRARNRAGIAAGGIAAVPAPTVTAPDVTDITAADKAARELSGVTTTWTLAGAIHHITVSVTASA